MASTSYRASLEPLTPALVGIGLLHVLGGMVLWIVMPMLPSRDTSVKLPAHVVWRGPEDFVGTAMSLEMPAVAQAQIDLQSAASKAVPASKPAGSPAPASVAPPSADPAKSAAPPVPPPDPALADSAKAPRIEFTSVKSTSSALSLAPTGLTVVIPGNSGPIRQLPPDTLAMLENSLGSSLSVDSMKAGPTTQILGAAQPALPPVIVPPQVQPQSPKPVESAPPPVHPGQGREANKYITLSAIVDTPPAPSKASLSLLDIAKLNDFERARKASEDISGLDAVEAALQRTLMSAWTPPSIEGVPANQRRVSVELAVLKDGTIKDAVLVTPSGSGALDASVRAALAKVKKIPDSLPASYTKERYAVRVNLQIE
ncbi:MAG: TonB C-terminal domain-containing protein [Verrucomicrobiota bacterium]